MCVQKEIYVNKQRDSVRQNNLSRRDLCVLSYKGSSSNHGMFLYNNTIKKCCSHTNKSLILNSAAM